MLPALTVCTFALVAQYTGQPIVEDIDFLGFSANERLAAWRAHIKQPQVGKRYARYRLIRIADAETQKGIGEFRDGGMKRFSRNGRRIRTSQMELEASNMRWYEASEQRLWKKLKKKLKLKVEQAEMHDNQIRIRMATDDAVQAKAIKPYIEVTGQAGKPMGYLVIARDTLGVANVVADFAPIEVPGVALYSRVRVFFSRSGLGVASLSTVFANGQQSAAIQIHRLQQAPLSNFSMGFRRLDNSAHEVARHRFSQSHPGLEEKWDKYVQW